MERNQIWKQMMLPGILTIGFPIIICVIPLFFGMEKLEVAEMLGGYMAGVTVSGVLWAIFQNNAGGAWDNAKKSFEAGVEINGEMTYKGSEAHKASVTGDTVGDPFKDTSGPSMNILIKLTCLIGLVIAPILGETHVHQYSELDAPKVIESTLSTKGTNISSISAVTGSFTFNKEIKTITDFIIKELDCKNKSAICEEFNMILEKNAITFKTNQKATEKFEEESNFNKKVSGELIVGNQAYNANLYFNAKGNDNSTTFVGSVKFDRNNTSVEILIKGKK